MRAASKRRGFEITSRSRPIKPSDFRDFDLILAMDKQNRGRLSIWLWFHLLGHVHYEFLMHWRNVGVSSFQFSNTLLRKVKPPVFKQVTTVIRVKYTSFNHNYSSKLV